VTPTQGDLFLNNIPNDIDNNLPIGILYPTAKQAENKTNRRRP
jgi:hypothetical protein